MVLLCAAALAAGLSMDYWPRLETAAESKPVAMPAHRDFAFASSAPAPFSTAGMPTEAAPNAYRPVSSAPRAFAPDPFTRRPDRVGVESQPPPEASPLRSLPGDEVRDELAEWLLSIPDLEPGEEEEDTNTGTFPNSRPAIIDPLDLVEMPPPSPATTQSALPHPVPHQAEAMDLPAPVQPHGSVSAGSGPASPGPVPSEVEPISPEPPHPALELEIENLVGPPLRHFPPTHGDLLQVTVTLRNNSAEEATDLLVRLTSEGPVRLDSDSALLSSGHYGLGLWDLPLLPAGQERVLSLLAIVESAAPMAAPEADAEITAQLMSFQPASAESEETAEHLVGVRFPVLPRQPQEELPGMASCAIHGAVFMDINGNALRDEPLAAAGLNGMRVDLYTADANPQWIETAVTSASPEGELGRYVFSDLQPGIYLVRLDPTSLPNAAQRFTTPSEYIVSCPVAPDDLGLATDFGLRFEPTAIELASFYAEDDGVSVRLRWSTAMEIEHLGFHLYRATGEHATRHRITPQMILAAGDGDGADYEFDDVGAEPGKPWLYWLEDIDWSFRSTLHGPFAARP